MIERWKGKVFNLKQSLTSLLNSTDCIKDGTATSRFSSFPPPDLAGALLFASWPLLLSLLFDLLPVHWTVSKPPRIYFTSFSASRFSLLSLAFIYIFLPLLHQPDYAESSQSSRLPNLLRNVWSARASWPFSSTPRSSAAGLWLSWQWLARQHCHHNCPRRCQDLR